jgi:predicted NBD/HSP70 family sugar kinase
VTGQSWSHTDLRAHHRALVLRVLDEHGSLTRAGIAEASGLSVPTAGSIVAQLIGEGVLAEVGIDRRSHERGPRATLVGLLREGIHAIGVYLGIGRIGIGRCDLNGSVTELSTLPFDLAEPPGVVLNRAIAAAAPLARAGQAPSGVGVAVPGAIDVPGHRALVRSAPLGWRDVDIAGGFERAFEVPTLVDYNVRAMGLAEHRYGRWRRPDNLLYLHLGVGVGFTFLVDGQPILQDSPRVSELGHLRVADSGPVCECGVTGCLESLTSTGYLRAQVAGALGETPARAGLLPALCVASEAGDAAAETVLSEFIDHLTSGLAAAVNLLGASRVALGGVLATAPGYAHDRIRQDLDAKVCAILRKDLDVQPSPIRSHPGVLGAATAAFEHLFFQPGPAPR